MCDVLYYCTAAYVASVHCWQLVVLSPHSLFVLALPYTCIRTWSICLSWEEMVALGLFLTSQGIE
jgi:hypothetical protein